MDLLIKGLAMPKNGEVLKLYLSDGFVGYQDDKGLHKAKAIELPPHGVLIERKDVVKVLFHSIVDVGPICEWAEIMPILDDVPTFLEASE